MAVTFRNAPLNEVALGYSFLPRPDILIPHVGKFWGAIAEAYPRCQHAPMIIDETQASMFMDMPLPRVWMISEDDTTLVQFQQDRLIFNWRERGDRPYVRFEAVRTEFERVRTLFEAFTQELTGTPVVPTAYSLTYVNLIRVSDGESIKCAFTKVFPGLGWLGHAGSLPDPLTVEWKATYSVPNGDGTLTATIQPARLGHGGPQFFKFELSVSSGSLGGRHVEFDGWVTVAHNAVLHAFEGLTSEEIRRSVWKRENLES